MACVSMFKMCTKLFISSFGVYKEMPVDVNATKGALNLPNYVTRIVKDNWTMEVFDLELFKGPYAPSKEKLMIALQLAMQCVTNPPSNGHSILLG
jgi:hypothetical protein